MQQADNRFYRESPLAEMDLRVVLRQTIVQKRRERNLKRSSWAVCCGAGFVLLLVAYSLDFWK